MMFAIKSREERKITLFNKISQYAEIKSFGKMDDQISILQDIVKEAYNNGYKGLYQSFKKALVSVNPNYKEKPKFNCPCGA